MTRKKFETCVNATSGNVDLEFVQIMSPEGRVGPQWRIKPNTCREQKLKLVWGIIIKWGGVGWIGLHWDINLLHWNMEKSDFFSSRTLML